MNLFYFFVAIIMLSVFRFSEFHTKLSNNLMKQQKISRENINAAWYKFQDAKEAIEEKKKRNEDYHYIVEKRNKNQYDFEKANVESYNKKGLCSPKKDYNFRKHYEFDFRKPIIKEHKKEILIAVIDTGYDFNNTVLRKAVPEKYLHDISKLNFSGTEYHSDGYGHGTHAASTILGVMSQAKILPLKYDNPLHENEDRLNALKKALRFAIDEKVDIINLSLADGEADDEEFKLLQEAEEKGIIIFAAAGNDGTNLDLEPSYPASYKLKNLIVVGNSTGGYSISPSSNVGETVDFFIRGKYVRSMIPSCETGYLSGTSMATPVLAGIYATIKAQYPEASFESIYKHIEKTAHVNNVKYESLKYEKELTSRKGFLENTKTVAKYLDLNTIFAEHFIFNEQTRGIATK